MKVVDPDLLDRLSNTNVTYSKAENSRCEKIIDLEDPTNPALNYNYYCISKDEPLESQKLNQEFLDFLNTHVRGSFIEHPVQLSQGVSFLVGSLLLHGRNPFEVKQRQMIGLFGRLVLNGRQINFGTNEIATINELDQLYELILQDLIQFTHLVSMKIFH